SRLCPTPKHIGNDVRRKQRASRSTQAGCASFGRAIANRSWTSLSENDALHDHVAATAPDLVTSTRARFGSAADHCWRRYRWPLTAHLACPRASLRTSFTEPTTAVRLPQSGRRSTSNVGCPTPCQAA